MWFIRLEKTDESALVKFMSEVLSQVGSLLMLAHRVFFVFETKGASNGHYDEEMNDR